MSGSGSSARAGAIAGRVASILPILLMVGCLALLASGRLYIIRSSSMAPAIRAGDAVFVRPLGHLPKVGDVITYGVRDEIVTHRVVETRPDGIVTKGDGNKEPDPWIVAPSDVRGRVAVRLAYLGWFLVFLRQPGGWFLLVVLPVMAFLVVQGRRTLTAYRDWKSQMEAAAPAPATVPPTVSRLKGDTFYFAASRRSHRRHGGGGHPPALIVMFVLGGLVVAFGARGSLAWLSGTQDTTLTVATGIPGPTTAIVDIKPETLQLGSEGEVVTAFIQLPFDDVSGIDVSTVRLCLGFGDCGVSGVPATDPQWNPGQQQLKVQFARADVIALMADIETPADVALTVSGVVGGRTFVGSDTVTVIGPPGDPSPSPAPTEEPSPSPTGSPSPEPTESPSPSPSDSPSPEPNPTEVPTPPASPSGRLT